MGSLARKTLAEKGLGVPGGHQSLAKGSEDKEKNWRILNMRDGWREHQNRLPREAVDPPSLEIFKIPMDTILGNLLYLILLLADIYIISRGSSKINTYPVELMKNG